MAGRRIDLSALADEPRLPDARIPRFAAQGQLPVPLEQVAANPLNTRSIKADSPSIQEIANSIQKHGQLQACTVVHRKAFLAIFPEYQTAIGDAPFVQVTGGRRRVALQLLGKTMDIAIKDDLAETREQFVGATAAENIDRQDYDAIEEALAVQLLVKEAGSTAAAGDRLSRTKTWVVQRTNLLKLSPEVQQVIRDEKVPLRDVRSLHTHPSDEQLNILRAYLSQKSGQAGDEEKPGEGEAGDGSHVPTASGKVPQPRTSPAVLAIRRLGGTPPKIAESLRSALSPEDLRALVELLSA